MGFCQPPRQYNIKNLLAICLGPQMRKAKHCTFAEGCRKAMRRYNNQNLWAASLGNKITFPFLGYLTPMRFACRSDRKSGKIWGLRTFSRNQARGASRAKKERSFQRGEPWVLPFSGDSFVQPALPVGFSLDAERKVNKNYLSGIILPPNEKQP